jgi:PiT family inorganic phosphate transporter
MAIAWVLTLPAAALVGAGAESVTGLGDWGTALVAVFLVAASAAIWKLSRREVVDHTNVVAETEEPAGVVTAAIAAVTPPPVGTITEDLTATIPAPAAAEPATEAAPPAATV